ncbi:MAG TPA: hypothetical protein EYG85_09770, partial [Crocinitomix sp.]|nr:hypothetical protein [Crocinitomix sp.]
MKNISLIIIIILLTITSFSQTKEEIKMITKDYDVEYLNLLSTKFSKENKENKEYAIKMAKINNWPIIIKTKTSLSELMEVVDGKPIYIETKNIDAAEATRANTLHNNGLL